MAKIKVGAKEAQKGAQKSRTLWTPPVGKSVGQILVDLEHVIEATTCTLFFDRQDIVWVACDDEVNDPCHKLGVEPRVSVIVPMLIKDDDGTKTQRFVRGPRYFWTLLRKLNSTNTNGIKGLIVTLERVDDGFSRYTFSSDGRYGKLSTSQDDVIKMFMDSIIQGDPTSVEASLKAVLGTDGFEAAIRAAKIKAKDGGAKPKGVVEEDF